MQLPWDLFVEEINVQFKKTMKWRMNMELFQLSSKIEGFEFSLTTILFNFSLKSFLGNAAIKSELLSETMPQVHLLICMENAGV